MTKLFRARFQDITEDDILGLHRLFYYRIDTDLAGKYRERNIIITGTDFTPPTPAAVPLAMQELLDSLPSLRQLNPVEYAAMLHLNLVTIHPFIDGNGRTARLLMNLASYDNALDLLLTMDDQTIAEYRERFEDVVETTSGIGWGFSSGGNSTLVYFSCEDCAVEASRVVDAGGQIHREKWSIGEYGFIALVVDTEGNKIGLHSLK